MRKTEIKKAKDNELVLEYVETYSLLLLNYNLGKGIKQLKSHFDDLSKEMVKRGILTLEDVEKLNQ